jgi:8-oxo-dGTP pyrophosphatase MutT (NUDIX family)
MGKDGVPYTAADLVDHEGVAAVVRDEQGRVLVQDHAKYGFWTIPVGKAEPGQLIEDALAQELQEECAIHPTKAKFLTKRNYIYMRDGKKVHMTLHLFEVLEFTGTVRNKEPQKHRIQKFKKVEEIFLLPFLSDATLLFLETIGKPRLAQLTDSFGLE